jgi:hypothetical protein
VTFEELLTNVLFYKSFLDGCVAGLNSDFIQPLFFTAVLAIDAIKTADLIAIRNSINHQKKRSCLM